MVVGCDPCACTSSSPPQICKTAIKWQSRPWESRTAKISVISIAVDRAAAFWGHEAIGTSQGGDAIVGCSVSQQTTGRELPVIFSEAPEPPT